MEKCGGRTSHLTAQTILSLVTPLPQQMEDEHGSIRHKEISVHAEGTAMAMVRFAEKRESKAGRVDPARGRCYYSRSLIWPAAGGFAKGREAITTEWWA